MKITMTSKKMGYSAIGEYDPQTRHTIVKKGSIVSHDVIQGSHFRSARSIEKLRAKVVIDNVLSEDVEFKSPSSAANFVAGRSKNGYISWKSDEGKWLREYQEI